MKSPRERGDLKKRSGPCTEPWGILTFRVKKGRKSSQRKHVWGGLRPTRSLDVLEAK